ncbi:MAG: corrinoid protein [Candidatus Promineifilaceae bacterium]|nr:corrinoid protein [Candidatus Promineifilaceae bacterium]
MIEMDEKLAEVYECIKEGDMYASADKVQAALNAGLKPNTILNEGMIAAMTEVGRLFEEGDYFVPEMLIAARAMQAGLVVLKPHLVASGVEPLGTVIIGTVRGDLHDIGKNLVMMMMEGAGMEVIDLGVDVNAEKFVAAAREHGADIVAMSALLTTTMSGMGEIVEGVRASDLPAGTKVMVGGAPVTAEFAESVGADGYAPDASQAASIAKSYFH